jgi:phosphoglycolate phosphatase
MSISFLIFDLDGTLADTAAGMTEALNEVIAPFHNVRFTVDEIKAVMGGGTSRLSKQFFDDHVTGIDWKTFTRRFAEVYRASFTRHTTLYPGVAETLQALSAWPKAVISNRPQSPVADALRHLGIISHFVAVVGGDSGTGRKPSPAPILQMLSRFGVEPADAIFVGDSIFDIEAGQSAGVRTVAATYGYGMDGFAAKADFVIDSFGQLLRIVESDLETDCV